MQIHQVKPHSKRKKKVQVGRGGKRGKTSGRGTKGQKARAGHKIRPEIRDVIKTLPKLRGRGKHGLRSFQAHVVVVNLTIIDKFFENGETVTPETLVAKGALRKDLGSFPRVKILGDGEITKKVTVENCAASGSAKTAIEKAGGSVK